MLHIELNQYACFDNFASARIQSILQYVTCL